MGIGISLATGLVQGFTRNIQEEKAMRLGEQEKLDALNTIIAEAAVGNKNFNKANADKLGDMIKSAQGKMDDRERINIFGQAAERVNVDFTGVLSTLSNAAADTDGTLTLKGDIHNLTFNRAKGEGDLNDAYAYLTEYASMLQNPAQMAKLKEDKTLWDQANNLVVASQSRIYNSELQSWNESQKQGQFLEPSIMGWESTPMFPGLGLHYNVHGGSAADGKRSLEGSTSDTPPEGKTPVATKVVVAGDGSLEVGTIDISTDLVDAFDAMSYVLGIDKNMSAEARRSTLYNFWIGVDGDGNQIDPDNQFYPVPGVSPAQKESALGASLQISNVNNVRGYDPEISLYKVDNEEMAEFLNTLTAADARNFHQKVMALAPYMKYHKKQTIVPRFRTGQDMGETRQQYVLSKRYGTKLIESGDKFTMDYLSKELSNKETALNSLNKLKEARNNLDDPEAYARFKKVLQVAFTGEQSIRAAIQKDLLGVGVIGESTDDLTDDYISGLEAGIEEKRKTGGEDLAELEAMRISLAFQLARAADPSGRLSNQDIQQQLDRLGAGFSTKDQALTKIQVVIDEMERDVKKLKVFVSYGKGNAVLKPEEAMIIDAAISVDYMENKVAALKGKEANPKAGPSFSYEDYLNIGNDANPVWIDGDANAVTDQGMIDALTTEMTRRMQAPQSGI